MDVWRCRYDVLADPSERSNVAAANPDVVARLAPVLQRYNDEQYVSGHLPASTMQQARAAPPTLRLLLISYQDYRMLQCSS